MAKRKRPLAKSSSQNNLIATTIREKFQYILIGLSVIILLAVIAFSLFNNKTSFLTFNSPFNTNQTEVTTGPLQKVIDTIRAPFVSSTPAPQDNINRYRIQEGDSLWSIAEKKYGSGFNASDIAQANNLENPSIIEVGTVIVLPSLTPKEPTQGEITAAAASTQATSDVTTYVVKQDDTLWMIAEQMYGDGFSYVRIAQANNIPNPSLIYPGTNLNIPR